MQWCIYWNEVDSFTAKVSQHWIDATTLDNALVIAKHRLLSGYAVSIALIANLTWHPPVQAR